MFFDLKLFFLKEFDFYNNDIDYFENQKDKVECIFLKISGCIPY